MNQSKFKVTKIKFDVYDSQFLLKFEFCVKYSIDSLNQALT